MRRQITAVALCALLITCVASLTSALPGDSSDPVVTKSYIDRVFTLTLREYAQNAVYGSFADYQKSVDRIYDELESLNLANGGSQAAASALYRAVARQIDLSAPRRATINYSPGDIFIGGGGCQFRVLGGEMLTAGVFVNLAAGSELAAHSPAPLAALLASEQGATLTAYSAGTVEVLGNFRYVPSPPVLHADIAAALNELGLLSGTTSGFAHERPATRVEGFVLMIILRGEREQALAFTGSMPFLDVPDWAYRFISYSYSKGYTAGTSATTFSPGRPLSADDYCSIMLMLLGYAPGADFDRTKALDFAVSLGMYTSPERARLRDFFNRDGLFFMEYRSLGLRLKDSDQTLLESLVAKGTVSEAAARSVMG
ncbi:MAG: S-layer homology domain-containing protein [Oscillospiraceae bacterium]|jgi:hypothetical protein|nr:S-layer homology domain-containing protein [Oscillospiraceae bacterium]